MHSYMINTSSNYNDNMGSASSNYNDNMVITSSYYNDNTLLFIFLMMTYQQFAKYAFQISNGHRFWNNSLQWIIMNTASGTAEPMISMELRICTPGYLLVINLLIHYNKFNQRSRWANSTKSKRKWDSCSQLDVVFERNFFARVKFRAINANYPGNFIPGMHNSL